MATVPGTETVRRGAVTFASITSAMDAFVDSKGWYRTDSKRPQTPRNLAMSLAIESAELLECFQWAEHAECADVADEIADIVLYAVQLAKVAGVDLEEAVTNKLRVNQSRTWDDRG